jgi:predicted xylose isomerase-like sugar epimerase
MTGKLVQTSEVRAGGSYLSSNDPRLHFGLAGETRISQVQIRWPMGEKEILKDIPADFIYTITEDKGITDKQALPALK